MEKERIAELWEKHGLWNPQGRYPVGSAGDAGLDVIECLTALEAAQAELATAKDAYVELAAGIRITEAEGGPLEQANQEIDRLRAELARLQSPAPVGGGVEEPPELTEEPVVVEDFADNGAHSQWRLVDRSTGETLWEEASRLPTLKEGEVVVQQALLDAAESYIAILENSADGYYRVEESEECKAYRAALRAQATTEGGAR